MANGIVNRQVNVYINSGEAQKAYDLLIKREKALNDELAKTADPKRIKALKGELEKLAEPIDRASKKMKGELAPSIRDLELATKKFLSEFKKTGDPATLANFQKFKAELDQAKAKLNGLEKAQGGLTKGGIFSGAFWANLAAGGITAVASQLSGFFTSTIEEALNADESTRRLETTLQNLGRSDAFDRITEKAGQLAQQFKYLDNDDIVAVFNKLIDYGKLTETEMNDLLPVIINFAAKSKTSIDESADVIIKALEGNAKALKTYGIDVSGAKTETERLNIVMTTLKEKVDGAAAAFSETASGKITTTRQEFANLKEELGNGLLPILNSVLSVVNKLIKGISLLGNAISDKFSGKSSFTGSLILGAAGNDSNRAQAEQIAQNELNLLNERVQRLKEAQKKGQLLDVTEAQVRENYVKQLQARADQFKQMVDADAKKVGPFNGAGKDRLLSNATNLSGLEQAINQIMAGSSNKALGFSQGSDATGAKTTTKNFVKGFTEAWKDGLNDLKDFAVNAGFINESGPDNTGNFNEFFKSLLPADQPFDPSIMQAVEKMILDNANRIDKLNFTILSTRGKARLKAQKELLDEEERQELGAKAHTAQEVDNIRLVYDQKRAELDTQYYEQQFKRVQEFAASALSIVTQFDQQKTDRENAELARDQKLNDKKKDNLDRRLRSGKISQLEYDRELQKIEAAQQKREKEIHIKQFQRQKRLSIAQALIDGALTISQIFRTIPKVIPGTIFPNPEFPIALGAAIAEKVATVAFLAAQKPPEFARGGMLGGRSHAAGGNAIIDGSGRKIAEIEAGEGITNKHTMADRGQYTVSGTPSQIVSRLNGLHGGVQWDGGAQLIPSWQTINPSRMNYAAMARRYATGGLFAQANSSSGGGGTDNSVLLSMQATLNQLNRILANGIPAYTLLTQNERQQARITSIRQDAVMKS